MVREKWTEEYVELQKKLAQVYQSPKLDRYMSKKGVPMLEDDKEVGEWCVWSVNGMKQKKGKKK